MITGLTHTHSLLRWILLVLLAYAVIRALTSGGNRYFEKDRKTALVVLILSHIQLLLGFSLYFMKGWHNMLGASETMKHAFTRFWAVEHMSGMLIAIVLITMGYSRVKKASEDKAKWKKQGIFFGLALVIILLMIPWPFRGEAFAGYGWF